jgi:hypothetical protein
MSYGLIYYGEAGDYFGNLFRVEIYERDYLGTNSEMILSGDSPIILDYPGDEFDIFRPIYGSQMSINIISETDFQYVNLHTADSRKYRVDILKAGVLFWRGWLIPDLFSEPYIAPPYAVKITARCGLGELEKIPMPGVVLSYGDGAPAVIGKTFVNLYSVLKHVFGLLDLGLNYKDAINIYNAERSTPPIDTDTTFTDTYVDLTQYAELSIYEFLADTFRTFGARLYQKNGYWYGVRLKEYQSEIRVREINFSDGSVSFETVTTNTFLIGKPQNNYILNQSPELRINPAWKQFDLIRKIQKKPGILDDPKFLARKLMNRMVPLPDFPETLVDFPYFAPEKWQATGIVESLSFADGGCRVDQNTNGNWFNRVYQSVQLEQETSMQGLKLTFEGAPETYSSNSPSSTSFAIRVLCTDGTQTKYAKLPVSPVAVSQELLVWTDTPTIIVIPNVPSSATYEVAAKKFQFGILGLPLTGTYEISIYGAQRCYMHVKNANVEITKILYQIIDPVNLIIGAPSLLEYETKFKDTVVINPLNSYIPDEIEIYGGDLPDIKNVESIYNYGYRNVAGSRTKIWHDYVDTSGISLIQHFKNQYRSIYILPQWVLQIPILSQNIAFDSAIVDYQIINKKYICTSASWDLVNCIFNGIFAEVGAWEGSPWILGNGTWNDEGIWVDDEVWNDEDPV